VRRHADDDVLEVRRAAPPALERRRDAQPRRIACEVLREVREALDRALDEERSRRG
jgi:hypothetical protein